MKHHLFMIASVLCRWCHRYQGCIELRALLKPIEMIYLLIRIIK